MARLQLPPIQSRASRAVSTTIAISLRSPSSVVNIRTTRGLKRTRPFPFVPHHRTPFGRTKCNVARSIVHGLVGPCKTESSQKPVPIHPLVVEAQSSGRYSPAIPEDWVFARRHSHRAQPYWGQAILQKYLRPAARELGIETRFGWHTGTHSGTRTRHY